MHSQEELLSFLDLLDLDEEMIDERLKSIMVRSNCSNQHLANALQLLRYKHLINIQENTECSNEEEFEFAVKLIKDLNADTVDNVCRVTYTVLKLNSAKSVSYSEHLLLQILSNIEFSMRKPKSSDLEKSSSLLYLKVCDSVLDATIKQGEKLSMVFLDTSLEEILSSDDEQLKVHFITNSVPKLVEGIHGYDILGKIWSYLATLRGDSSRVALKVLSSLSDFYLPVAMDEANAKFESTLVYNYRFWEIVCYGITSDDQSLRKISVYLAKRAVDYVSSLKANIIAKFQDHIIFSWDNERHAIHKSQWDNFFILIDSLEEKQSNIVMPSLQLFESLTEIDHSWLNCAYNLGLRHDNNQVRLRCLEHRLKANLHSGSEAAALLTALNDINFYENKHECKSLKEKLSQLLKNESNLMQILKVIPQAHLSPVPFYHLSHVIAELDLMINSNKDFNVSQIIIDILKASCNIITIREAIHFNIAQFVGKSCKNLHWKEIASIYVIVQSETWTIRKTNNDIFTLISSWDLDELNKKMFYDYVTESHSNISIGMLYLENHDNDIDTFTEIINDKIKTIQEVVNRQYSNKIECFNEIQYILNLQLKCSKKLKQFLLKAHKTILQYAFCIISSDITLSIDETKSIFNFNSIHFIQENDLKEIVIQLYKISVILLQDPQTDLNKIIQSMLIVSCLSHNNDFIHNFSHEMLDSKRLLQLEASFKKKAGSNAQSLGRLRNVFYETHCKTVFKYLEKEDCFNSDMKVKDVNTDHLKDIIDYVEKVIECGGYGCLEWILKIINKTYNYTNSHLNLTQFINRMWSEIEELKSSNQYLPCMIEFVKLITQRKLIENLEFNNIVVLYCSKIIEYGLVNNSPLYYLVDNGQLCRFINEQNKERNTKEYGHLVYILSEILLFCPVPRKDHRITDNLTLDILKKFGEGCNNAEFRFYFTVQYKAILELSKIDESATLQALATFIMAKIDHAFKAKLRYHGNSQIHRTLQTALQHLLYILFLKLYVDDTYSDSVSNWCMELLGRLPHQPSVRICLEWHIALHFYKKTSNIENLLPLLQRKRVPLTSQLTIIYWLLKRKLANTFPNQQFEFAMDWFLSHTMGQMFNVRLLAQYLATKLYDDPSAKRIVEDNKKYDYIIEVIQKTLDDNSKDKNFVKLKEDYFMNEFDIVASLTPFFVYHTMPRLCEVGNNEAVDLNLVSELMGNINKFTERSINPDFLEEWKNNRCNDECVKLELNRHVDKKIHEDVEALSTIQKKYIPWKSMSDINVYNIEKKRESPSDLIVVASLIDKLPNLGGMARTSEVFGVRTYVIDSLRHVQDRQFQGLSVSAERWIDVEEVRPGPPLKEYLNRMKAQGYSIVAAEQTSTSKKLQMFKFPRKTLLLLGNYVGNGNACYALSRVSLVMSAEVARACLFATVHSLLQYGAELWRAAHTGHEKDGIPCDLLPMMDHCVEIPQQGFVRSLNVHVTAAIFIWEYARQNIL